MMPARSPLSKHVMWCASTLSVVQTAVAIAMSRSSAAHEKQDPRPSGAARTQRLLAILPPRDRRGAEHAAPPPQLDQPLDAIAAAVELPFLSARSTFGRIRTRRKLPRVSGLPPCARAGWLRRRSARAARADLDAIAAHLLEQRLPRRIHDFDVGEHDANRCVAGGATPHRADRRPSSSRVAGRRR